MGTLIDFAGALQLQGIVAFAALSGAGFALQPRWRHVSPALNISALASLNGGGFLPTCEGAKNWEIVSMSLALDAPVLAGPTNSGARAVGLPGGN